MKQKNMIIGVSVLVIISIIVILTAIITINRPTAVRVGKLKVHDFSKSDMSSTTKSETLSIGGKTFPYEIKYKKGVKEYSEKEGSATNKGTATLITDANSKLSESFVSEINGIQYDVSGKYHMGGHYIENRHHYRSSYDGYNTYEIYNDVDISLTVTAHYNDETIVCYEYENGVEEQGSNYYRFSGYVSGSSNSYSYDDLQFKEIVRDENNEVVYSKITEDKDWYYNSDTGSSTGKYMPEKIDFSGSEYIY